MFGSKLVQGLLALISLINPKTWGPFLHAYQRTKFDHDFAISYSQYGEDLALLTLFQGKVGSYIDVGAHHPDRFSNTRLLYQKGWSGINVEANPHLVDRLKQKRPRDITLWGSVGTSSITRFSIFEDPSISTSQPNWKANYLNMGNVVAEEIEVPGITVRSLIERYFEKSRLELLLIDAEGSDFDVLKSLELETLDVTKHPEWILVETSYPVERSLSEETVQYVKNFDYVPYLVLPTSTILRKS